MGINAVQTTDVEPVELGGRTGAVEHIDATHFAEVVFCHLRIELVNRQVFLPG
jgi:hypothetical protein